MSTPIWLFDIASRRKVWANRAAVELWKAPDLASLLDRETAVDMTPIAETPLDGYLRRLESEERIIEQWSIFPDGNPLKLSCACSIVSGDDGNLLLFVEVLARAPSADRTALTPKLSKVASDEATTVNLSRAHQIEELTRGFIRERHFTEALIDSIRLLVVVVDHAGYVKRINRAVTELTAFEPNDVVGRPIWDTLLSGPDAQLARHAFERSAEPGRERLPRQVESELVTKSKAARLVAWTVTVVPGEAGQREYFIAMGNDLTEQRGVEQRLQINDRLASIGTLAAGVAHGINNPLSYVIANLEYVKRSLVSNGATLAASQRRELDEILTDSLDGAERVRRIVSDLGLFSTPEEARIDSVDLQSVVERALSIAENEIRHRARIVRDFKTIPPVLGTHTKLGQVALNVLLNAAQAIEAGDVEHNAVSVRTRIDEKGRPELEISDSGCGIQAEHLPRIFDPFFTTKPVGIGTGLGLSIAHRIVTEFGGEILVQSAIGKGTTVKIALEAAPEGILPSVIASAPPRPPLAVGKERAKLLVVDDEPGILRALCRILSAHEVSVALSGREAIEKIQHDGPFDVILCDVMMPELSGIDVYEKVLAMGNGQEKRIVFMTGGAFTGSATAFLNTVKNTTIPKPFRPDDVRWLVQTMTAIQPSADASS